MKIEEQEGKQRISKWSGVVEKEPSKHFRNRIYNCWSYKLDWNFFKIAEKRIKTWRYVRKKIFRM